MTYLLEVTLAMTTLLNRGLAAALAVVILGIATPLTGAAAHRHVSRPALAVTGTAFEFGHHGGNIRPFDVTISSTGAVTTSGPVTVANPSIHLSKDALNGLLKLAQAEHFFSLPATVQSSRQFPDAASPFIAIHTDAGVKRVEIRNAHNLNFDELFSVLMAASGVTFGI